MSFEAQLEAARLAAIAKAERLMADPAELSAFLAARLDEDEAAITAMGVEGAGRWWVGQRFDGSLDPEGSTVFVDVRRSDGLGYIHLGRPGVLAGPTAVHIARHNPVRVLAEVAVKRERLRMYVQQRETLRDVYANPDKYTFDQQLAAAVSASVQEALVRMDATVHERHPDFKAEWRLP